MQLTETNFKPGYYIKDGHPTACVNLMRLEKGRLCGISYIFDKPFNVDTIIWIEEYHTWERINDPEEYFKDMARRRKSRYNS